MHTPYYARAIALGNRNSRNPGNAAGRGRRELTWYHMHVGHLVSPGGVDHAPPLHDEVLRGKLPGFRNRLDSRGEVQRCAAAASRDGSMLRRHSVPPELARSRRTRHDAASPTSTTCRCTMWTDTSRKHDAIDAGAPAHPMSIQQEHSPIMQACV